MTGPTVATLVLLAVTTAGVAAWVALEWRRARRAARRTRVVRRVLTDAHADRLLDVIRRPESTVRVWGGWHVGVDRDELARLDDAWARIWDAATTPAPLHPARAARNALAAGDRLEAGR